MQHDIACMADVCSSGGVVNDLPGRMTEGFSNFGIGLIVCHEGEFEFTLSGRTHKPAGAKPCLYRGGVLQRGEKVGDAAP